MSYAAKVICDSVSDTGRRLTTIEITLPRIVLAEFNTHRMLSRNSASSRAIPVEKRIAAVQADPFVPAAFGGNKPGMQAGEALAGADDDAARREWTSACRAAVTHARGLANVGVHKQLANRLLEPFLWHTIVCSATEWSNFFALRCHPDAQPEIRTAAEMMRDARSASTPRLLRSGEWHLPYVDESHGEPFAPEFWCRVSAGRCARVSTLTHDGRRDPGEDARLADRLRLAGHLSPFEHVAQPWDHEGDTGNFIGWLQLRKRIPFEENFARILTDKAEATV